MQTFETIFVYIDKDVDGDVEGVASKVVRDAFNIELEGNFKDCFVQVNRFVEVVSMHIIANINILVTGDFVDDIEGVSMLIMKEKKHVEIITISIIFFAWCS